jgi:hypothetical protein
MVKATVFKSKTEFHFVDGLLNKQIFNCVNLSLEERCKRIGILSEYAYPDNVHIGEIPSESVREKRRKE